MQTQQDTHRGLTSENNIVVTRDKKKMCEQKLKQNTQLLKHSNRADRNVDCLKMTGSLEVGIVGEVW